MQEIQSDIKEIKADIKQLIVQGVEHNVLLKQHEARSLSLENRQDLLVKELKPIALHVQWANIILKTLGAVGIALAIQWLSKILL